MGISFWQILIIAVIVVLLFGRGKISELMGDVAKGVKSFRKGLADDDDEDQKGTSDASGKTIEHTPSETVKQTSEDRSKAG
ncbi:twin-arginine translocase TatA/TatE family subunit [Amorphus orientalis]|uniref:Sec-independent protein translocase protein TatA n=1 Tax=Amorphus orientalis TaxID=649198 RepID=A0AAE3VQR6_9HYPH|nr:twin-arginine translocase TatA/TatE family subunit [Amorphus orientalis]MDQ0316233.1 sec-independent protein translocase protein TatA [Amorphus orientalis]